MDLETQPIYPDAPAVVRSVQAGGLTKSELLAELRRNAVSLNESAERLFASEHFTVAASRYSVVAVELAVAALGFPQGAATAEIYARAEALGLGLCPLELGPHLRLQYLDQPEGYWGQPELQHQAPSGSITIASAPLADDDDFPKGFYLRRIKGALWLRGYRSGAEHIWSPGDRLLFRRAYGPAMAADQPAIRRATRADAAAVAALTDAAYRKYIPRLGRKPQPMTADYALLVEQHPTWLVEIGQRLAGVLVLQHEPDTLLIYSVAINPDDQRRGLGRLLLGWAERQALLAGYRSLRLYTNALMQENIALYTRLGYRETRREAYQGGEVVHMSKQLSPAPPAG